ncbi:hypothetical protein OOT46_04100 [Aquabacterium sp. A7-Y]|uniref:hypothetical protein n=1 Tax=Aquabacterium sp. A7-Y TaxID=1349605 RepID=UPI00223DFCD7|nr:hypothetical protein [Aquabacterium sp. A7-Y]MCW7537033.1 hypothetical protein [Aquabacterium sp. A7-Y]
MMLRPHTVFAAAIVLSGAAAGAPAAPEAAAAAEPPPVIQAPQPARAAPSPAAKQAAQAQAGDRCEAAVAETVRAMRGREAEDVQFIGSKRALSPMSDDETGVKGEGRYQGAGGAVPFTYSCAYNASTSATSGVVFRETGRARALAEAAREPDVTHVSPEACETAAAGVLKQKYPRVGRIVFGSDSRRLRATSNIRTSLEGQGGVERAPGMNAIPFSYRCDFDSRNGRILSAQTAE